jgi:hypothetical protein
MNKKEEKIFNKEYKSERRKSLKKFFDNTKAKKTLQDYLIKNCENQKYLTSDIEIVLTHLY